MRNSAVKIDFFLGQIHDNLIIANFLFNIASNFNQFYRDCPVISEENVEIQNARLMLVNGVKIVIKNGLNLLGIDAPKEM